MVLHSLKQKLLNATFDSIRFLSLSSNKMLLKLNSVAVVRKRTIPTERPQLVGEVSAKICGQRALLITPIVNYGVDRKFAINK
jgi:hypothetical protein